MPYSSQLETSNHMTFYGLADYRLTTYGQVIDFYISPDDRGGALRHSVMSPTRTSPGSMSAWR
jgi:hypothetical protein